MTTNSPLQICLLELHVKIQMQQLLHNNKKICCWSNFLNTKKRFNSKLVLGYNLAKRQATKERVLSIGINPVKKEYCCSHEEHSCIVLVVFSHSHDWNQKMINRIFWVVQWYLRSLWRATGVDLQVGFNAWLM